jgi:hypothetical protein
VSFSATADLKEIRNSINQELLNFVAAENKYLNEIASGGICDGALSFR